MAAWCGDGDTSIQVTSSSGYPLTGNFRIMIGSELMLVTGVSDITWTVSRAIESTSLSSHGNGASVNHVVTAGALTQALIQSTSGPVANLPTTTAADGDEYWPSDSVYKYRYNGAVWEAWGPIYKCQPFDPTGFTWGTQQGAMCAPNHGGYLWTQPVNSPNFTTFTKPSPSPSYILTTTLSYNVVPANWGHWGIGFKFRVFHSDPWLVTATGPTYFFPNVTLQIKNTGANLEFYYGPDPCNQRLFYSELLRA